MNLFDFINMRDFLLRLSLYDSNNNRNNHECKTKK